MKTLAEKIDALTDKFSSQDSCEICAVEELAGLISAIQHKLRGRHANLAEEMAHVTIMIESLRKKYSVSTDEIVFYEHDMVERYLSDEVWDKSHVPSNVKHNVAYNRNGKTFLFTTMDYADAMDFIEKIKAREPVEDIVYLNYYLSDDSGRTSYNISLYN